MTEEFNLSNKGIDKCELPFMGQVYLDEDVKEFIRLLKEEIRTTYLLIGDSIIEIIDKLAGDKLK